MSTWTQIGDTLGSTIRPSEQLRKDLKHIPWDDPPPPEPRKHWKTIVELENKAYNVVYNVVNDFQENPQYNGPYCHGVGWDAYKEKKIKASTSELLSKLFNECAEHGWFAPRIINGSLTFASLYRVERHRSERDFVPED